MAKSEKESFVVSLLLLFQYINTAGVKEVIAANLCQDGIVKEGC